MKKSETAYRRMSGRLVDHDTRVRQGVPHAGAASGQQQRGHAGRLADTPRGHRWQDVLHRVIDTQPSGHRAT